MDEIRAHTAEIGAHIDEREARTDEIGVHIDEKEARTDEKGGAHRWNDDEGGACGGARTPQWGCARLETGRACLVEGARTLGGGRAHPWGAHTPGRGACTLGKERVCRMLYALEEGAYA
jgi:hypothetical protein